MLSEASKTDQAAAAVLFSAGLDSAVLLAHTARHAPAVPLYVSTGLAWERDEIAIASRLLATPPYRDVKPLVTLQFDMRDVYPATHWAVRGEAPAFDTPDKAVYLEGRNLVLITKAAVYMAREHLTRVLLGPLSCNPFPDATPEFFAALQEAVSLGLDRRISIETPFASMHKADVIRLGTSLAVPMELTLSCMQPVAGVHCGRCSKCRERRDAFIETGIEDPTQYAAAPPR